MTRPVLVAIAATIIGFAAGATVEIHREPEPVRATNFVSADVLVDATLVELNGYGPDGKLGKFLYDCVHEDGRLVCTQRKDVQP